MVERADFVVAGGGPAGAAAAITLARLGRRVVLADKAVFPRDKCCGDGLTTAALRRLEDLGLQPSTIPSWQPVEGVTVVATNGRRVDLELPGDGLFAASAKREELDASLLDVAAGAGVEIRAGDPVVGVEDARGQVRVALGAGEEIQAPYLLACDGMWSPTRKILGLSEPGYLGEWQAGRTYYERTGPEARRLWVWFEPDMVPGYAWSFPLAGGAANAGYGVIRAVSAPSRQPGPAVLRGQSIDLMARPHIGSVLGPHARAVPPWRAWPIPARIGRSPLSALGGRVLFAGDAAGACDPMTGEGIAQALETGEMAARAALAAGPEAPQQAATSYRRRIRWGLAVDDRLASLLSRVLARPTGSARALAVVDRGDWYRRNFARWMFEDYPRAALVTPHRWRRHLFTSPGAYRSPTA